MYAEDFAQYWGADYENDDPNFSNDYYDESDDAYYEDAKLSAFKHL